MTSRISKELIKIMESELGEMGPFVVKKQCNKLDIDPENITVKDIPPLSKALSESMKMFGYDKARVIYQKMQMLSNR